MCVTTQTGTDCLQPTHLSSHLTPSTLSVSFVPKFVAISLLLPSLSLSLSISHSRSPSLFHSQSVSQSVSARVSLLLSLSLPLAFSLTHSHLISTIKDILNIFLIMRRRIDLAALLAGPTRLMIALLQHRTVALLVIL